MSVWLVLVDSILVHGFEVLFTASQLVTPALRNCSLLLTITSAIRSLVFVAELTTHTDTPNVPLQKFVISKFHLLSIYCNAKSVKQAGLPAQRTA